MSATFKINGLQEKAPKLETSKNGKKYAKISLTVTSSKGRKTWFNNIMLWENMAENYVSKTKEGQEIELEGILYVKSEIDASTNQKKAVIALDVKGFKVQGEDSPEEPQQDEPSDDVDFDSLKVSDDQD
jgi:single-stranded DNA-binding protein